ncbi:nuclear factor 7, brain-like [Alosa alosa]|nr:nuclear factor 7, brain-like [Alosa alosa]
MQEIVQYTPVILDPNTAFSRLILSDDLTAFRDGLWPRKGQCLPANPERLKDHVGVLGFEGFKSGVHSWIVDVYSATWLLGVMEESAQRQRGVRCHPEYLYLEMESECAPDYRACFPPDKLVKIKLEKELLRVTVTLNCDEGMLTFTDSMTNDIIHTIQHTFTQTVYPFFSTICPDTPLRLLHMKISINLQSAMGINRSKCYLKW